ncbi:TPM domain-containing protein [Saccharicrinis aurantiacus]|uniref:TPM domain-containing protein n=1 Tax=Saccharicrinis aurantiacus TaxID=1849719 RepID=UPI0024939D17|nr:TPM domain-containing protein [Saccharicrinis aurantiacus]
MKNNKNSTPMVFRASNVFSKLGVVAVMLLLSISVMAQDIPSKPNPPRLVNDLAGILNQQQVSQLENYLVQFAKETSTQVVVVTTPDLGGTDKADFTFKLGDKWGVGQAGKNNGIVVMVKPKTRTSNGEAFIATGYGLEGVVPDAIAKQIVENDMIPRFKQNDYFGGIASGVQVIADITRGEYTADEYTAKHEGSPFSGIIGIVVIFVLVSFISRGSKHDKNNMGGRGSSLPFWLMMSMMGGSSRSHGGSFGNFSSGSGGFGGFGGGSFGGGGAGGSW